MEAEISYNNIFSRRKGNKRASENSESAWKKWWYKICMWIGAETIFKEVLLPSVCFLVYVPSYLVKGPVGTNKGKKMEHFSLEKHMQISYAFQFFSLNHFAWQMDAIPANGNFGLCKELDKPVVVVEIHCKVFS